MRMNACRYRAHVLAHGAQRMEGQRNLAMRTVIRLSSRSIVILPNSQSHHAFGDRPRGLVLASRQASEIFPSTLREKQTFLTVERLIRDIGRLDTLNINQMHADCSRDAAVSMSWWRVGCSCLLQAGSLDAGPDTA